MTNSIEQDDKRMDELLMLQDDDPPRLEGYDAEDEKMDTLLTLQSMTQYEPDNLSMEEKYEEQILMDEVMGMVNNSIFQPSEMNDEREKELLESKRKKRKE